MTTIRYRKCLTIARFTAVAASTLLIGCSSSDLSCTETATCAPLPPANDGSSNAARDASSDAADAAVTDGVASSDRQGGDARSEASGGDVVGDARNDSNSSDSRTTDGPVVDSSAPRPDTGAGRDATTIADASNEHSDAGSDESDAASPPIDVSTGNDAAIDVAPDAEAPVMLPKPGDARTQRACGGQWSALGVAGDQLADSAARMFAAADKVSVVCEDPGYAKYKRLLVRAAHVGAALSARRSGSAGKRPATSARVERTRVNGIGGSVAGRLNIWCQVNRSVEVGGNVHRRRPCVGIPTGRIRTVIASVDVLPTCVS